MAEYNGKTGVWRTVGGRRIFIADGEDLATAMKRSGKFERKQKIQNSETEDIKHLDNLKKKGKINQEQYDNAKKETINFYKERLKNKDSLMDISEAYRHYEQDYENEMMANEYYGSGNKLPNEKDYLPGGKKWNNEWESSRETKLNKEQLNNIRGINKKYGEDDYKEEYELFKRAKEDPDSIDPMTENSTDWHELEAKYGERYLNEIEKDNPFRKEEKTKQEKIDDFKKSMEKIANQYEQDKKEGKIVQRLTENELNERKIRKEAKEIKTGNDYLPKECKITTQGTSNRKEVSDNIQAHILSYYDNPVDFMEEMDAIDYLPTRWRAGEEMAKGGNYLIYNRDMQDYLGTLGINPKGKKFSDDRAFQTYTSLVGRESERLYTKMEKLFEQYKKEHKNSNATLDDFRKWFK